MNHAIHPQSLNIQGTKAVINSRANSKHGISLTKQREAVHAFHRIKFQSSMRYID